MVLILERVEICKHARCKLNRTGFSWFDKVTSGSASFVQTKWSLPKAIFIEKLNNYSTTFAKRLLCPRLIVSAWNFEKLVPLDLLACICLIYKWPIHDPSKSCFTKLTQWSDSVQQTYKSFSTQAILTNK